MYRVAVDVTIVSVGDPTLLTFFMMRTSRSSRDASNLPLIRNGRVSIT